MVNATSKCFRLKARAHLIILAGSIFRLIAFGNGLTQQNLVPALFSRGAQNFMTLYVAGTKYEYLWK